MTRSNEWHKQEDLEIDNPPVSSDGQHGARTGISREAAQREMDKFRGPSEYNVRTVVGRRTALQPAHPTLSEE